MRFADHVEGWIAVAALITMAACSKCTPPSTPTPSCGDGQALHTYRCPAQGDSGPAWTCQDGCESEPGSCLAYGCVPE